MFELTVDGMSCGKCVARITKAFQAADAKSEVKVDLAASKVTVNTALSGDEVKSVVDEAGYAVRDLRQG